MAGTAAYERALAQLALAGAARFTAGAPPVPTATLAGLATAAIEAGRSAPRGGAGDPWPQLLGNALPPSAHPGHGDPLFAAANACKTTSLDSIEQLPVEYYRPPSAGPAADPRVHQLGGGELVDVQRINVIGPG